VDPNPDVGLGQRRQEAVVEVSDRLGCQRQAPRRAVAGLDQERVIDEVEIDLERAPFMRDRGSGQATRRHVQGHVPRMIDPRRPGQPDLADDLGPQMQRRAGVLPGLIGQSGPWLGLRAA
jgi:hypothetical protein